ncbi:TetR/AcrR family transcriptional regulator [Xanthomonas arboricola pv. corylina]|uniref:TetR/AcrR family transcriptional regulator n=1 Tax=Xanthomonas arboricola TaxID=56448 RepID=UPI0012685952|nr:TetR/AcrR family transcriptional regulator [Xanthomonas arboricola]
MVLAVPAGSREVKVSRMGRPTAAASKLLHERVLCAARAVFLEMGFERASMERVCEVADVAKATLYRKFPDKFSLLKAVLMAPDLMRALPEVRPGKGESFTDTLARLAHDLLEWTLDRDLLGVARLSVETRAIRDEDMEADARRRADAVCRLVEEAFRLERPCLTFSEAGFYSRTFVNLIVQPRYIDAMEGRRNSEYTTSDQVETRRLVEFFIQGWNGTLLG